MKIWLTILLICSTLGHSRAQRPYYYSSAFLTGIGDRTQFGDQPIDYYVMRNSGNLSYGIDAVAPYSDEPWSYFLDSADSLRLRIGEQYAFMGAGRGDYNLRLTKGEFNSLSHSEKSNHLRALCTVQQEFPIVEFKPFLDSLIKLFGTEETTLESFFYGGLIDTIDSYLEVAYSLNYTVLEVFRDFTGHLNIKRYFRKNHDFDFEDTWPKTPPLGVRRSVLLPRIQAILADSEGCGIATD